jgi:glycerol-3-phosphate acyltransferase PlsY
VLFALLILFAYLLGSVPFGLLIARAHGVDLRKVGSGNIGATNAVRHVGKPAGILCFVLDVLKGFVPMLLVPMLGLVSEDAGPLRLTLWLLVGCAAVLGHVFPLYLKFKGGKGVATSLGIVLGLWPYYTVCGMGAFIIWLVVVFWWRYVSVASMAAAISFPVFLAAAIAAFDERWTLARLWPLLLIAVSMSLLVVLRHRENIKRLAEGSESKVFQKVVSSNDSLS